MKNKVFRFSLMIAAACLLSCALLAVVATENVWGRFISRDGSSQSAGVAKFVFDVEDASSSFSLDISEVDHPGAKTEYSFTVSNGTVSVSEVAQSVSAQITLSGELPLSITLKNGDTELIRITSPGTAAADIAAFAAGVTGSETLVLTVEWPPDKNDAVYSEKTAKISISLVAEQTD